MHGECRFQESACRKSAAVIGATLALLVIIPSQITHIVTVVCFLDLPLYPLYTIVQETDMGTAEEPPQKCIKVEHPSHQRG